MPVASARRSAMVRKASHGERMPANGRCCPGRSPAGRGRARACVAAGAPPPPPAGILKRVFEQHLHRPRLTLLATGEERGAPLLQRKSVGEEGRHVDPSARYQREVDLHRMAAPPLELLHAEGVRADDRDLLEVERCPLEAAWHLDPGDDDRAPRRGDAEPHLERLGEADGVVHDVEPATVEPGEPVPGGHDLRARLGGDPLDDVARRCVGQAGRGAEALRERPLVREARDREHAGRGVEGAQDRDGEEPERPAAVDERGRAGGGRALQDAVQRHRERVGKHGLLVAHAGRDRDAHRLVRRHEGREATRRPAAVAGVDAGGQDAAGEVPADGILPLGARGTGRLDAARGAGEPGVQHHPLAGRARAHPGPDALDRAHHLVSQHLGERDHRRHRVVHAAVQEHLLVVAAADAAETRADGHPVGRRQLGLGELAQRRRRERAEEEALVDPAEEAGHHLARDAQLAHERAHAGYQSRCARGNQAACRAGPRSGTMAAVARSEASNPRRAIPSVERLLQAPAGAALAARWRREHVVETTRAVLEEIRRAAGDGTAVPPADEVLRRVAVRLEAAAAPRLVRVVNASGVVLHTNLGRAPLAEEAIAALVGAARHAANLELDLVTGRRGDRDGLVADDLRALTGAEAALVVNNNAAAVLLALNTLAAEREVLVSRGELVEIGGSFRIPDVMAKSGARLREVGTTNRTHADDYRRALGPSTALLLKVHTSNYRVVGFTAAVELAELVAIGREAGVPVMEDRGSGALAALGATLRLYRESPDLAAALPALRWLTRPLAELEAVGRAAAPLLARRLGEGYRVTLVPSECEVGSGAVPALPLPSRALAVEHAEVSAERIAARFRAARPPVLGRIHDGRFLLDLRGIFDAAELAVDL